MRFDLFVQPDIVRADIFVTQVEGNTNLIEAIVNQFRADVFSVTLPSADAEQNAKADAETASVTAMKTAGLVRATASATKAARVR